MMQLSTDSVACIGVSSSGSGPSHSALVMCGKGEMLLGSASHLLGIGPNSLPSRFLFRICDTVGENKRCKAGERTEGNLNALCCL